LATTHVHANCCRFIFRRVAGGQPVAPVGARFIFTNLASLAGHGAVWFLLWWLFLHRRLTSRQRGSKSEDCERLSATPRLIISSKRDCVFIRCRSGKALRLILSAKPFGFSAGCDSCNSRLLLLSNNASPHRLPVPSLVTTPISIATRCALYARAQFKSSRKYFKSRRGWLWKSLWKILGYQNC
jgi:hypothetical protein